MKRILRGIASATLLAAIMTPIAHAQTPDERAIRRVIEAVAAYSQANNLDAIDTLFAPERGIHIIEGAGVNHGWADYRDNHLGPELESFEERRVSVLRRRAPGPRRSRLVVVPLRPRGGYTARASGARRSRDRGVGKTRRSLVDRAPPHVRAGETRRSVRSADDRA